LARSCRRATPATCSSADSPPRQTFPLGVGAAAALNEDAKDLALSVGDAAKGDYPVDIYTLESGDAPQARRSLVLRVEAEQQAYQPTASADWASALLDLTPSPSAALDPVVPAIHGPAQEGEKPACSMREPAGSAACLMAYLIISLRSSGA